MNLTIDHQAGLDYLACTVTGNWVTAELMRFVDTAAAEVKTRGYRRILADMSAVTGLPSELDRFFMGKHVAALLLGIKTAVIYNKVYADKFFEDTAVNRGAWIMIFSDKQAAMEWLLKDKPENPETGFSPMARA